MRAAHAIRPADALVITAGAGMGVDSGLPDFRGNEGFWRAYPPFAKLGLSFVELANPQWFARDPALAWGFYGHRFHLYRATPPQAGFSLLRRWAAAKAEGAFVFTSNVDGHFQRAGFDPDAIVECHGSLNHLQCTRACTAIWPAPESMQITLDPGTLRARPPWPSCPHCGALARPNVLMFGDHSWRPARTAAQEERLEAWLQARDQLNLTIVELGAGRAVPTVRYFGEELSRRRGAQLIRINPREADGPAETIEVPLGALDALERIDALLARDLA